MPGFVEMTREERIGFFLAPLLTVVAFALLGGIIHLLWIAFAGGSADPLRQPLVDRAVRWSLFWASLGFLSGMVEGLRHGGHPFGSALGVPIVLWGLPWMACLAVLGALAATLWTWIDMGFWSLAADLSVGITLGSLAAVIPATAVAKNWLNAEPVPESDRTPYLPTPPGQLPAEELERITAVRGEICTAVELLVTRDAGEEFDGDTTAGFVEVGWGLSLRFGSGANLVLSWSGDQIEVPDPTALQGRSSLFSQPVSTAPPWDGYVGSTLDGFETLTQLSEDRYHPFVWGIELRFSTARLLVGALEPGVDFEYLLATDQVLVVYDSATIDRCLGLPVHRNDD